MRNWITLLMTCLVVGSTISYAEANIGQVNLEAGYRRDNITWRDRVPSSRPRVKQSLRFEDLDIFQIGASGRTTLGYNFYVRANAYWGQILDGDFKRHEEQNFSDYGNSHARFGFEGRNHSVIDDNWVYGVGIAVGYPFFFCDCTTIVAPVIGYSFDEQSVRVDDSNFDFGNNDSYSTSARNTNNGCSRRAFNSRWYGGLAGVDFNYRPYNDCWNFWADFEYHWGDFRGRTSHNDTASDFDRNRHSRNATGWLFYGGAEYDINHCWTVGLSFKYQDWDADRHHRVRDCGRGGDSDDDSGYGERGRQNNRWQSWALNLTLGRDF